MDIREVPIKQANEMLKALRGEELPLEIQEKIKASLTLCRLKKGERVLNEGEVSSTDYFIVSGAMKMGFINHEGIERIVFIGVENNWIGDLSGYFGTFQSDYFIEALEDCEVLGISYADFENLTDGSQLLAYINRRTVIKAYYDITQRLLQYTNKSAFERFEQFMETKFHLLNRVPHKTLAAFIGISPEYFSKNLKRWYKERE